MAIIVGRYAISDGKYTYKPGSVIHHLSDAEEKRLVDAGDASFPLVTEAPVTNHPEDSTGGGENNIESLTIDEFSKLKADPQKALLEQLGIDPASNEPGRLEQYQAYLDSLIDNEGGPNTSLPE